MRTGGKKGPDPIDLAVGERVRVRRRWMNISQTTLAGALGITFQQVQKYEKGSNRVSASMLVKTAAALETTVAALVGEDMRAPVQAITVARLDSPDAVELLRAFSKLRNADQRRAIIAVANVLAGPESETNVAA